MPVGVWQEVEKIIGDSEPEPIMDGQKLTWWSDIGVFEDPDGDINLARVYEYNPENLGIAVSTSGSIEFENGLAKFFNLKNGVSMETVAIVQYDQEEETLTFRDTTVIPPVEIKLIKIQKN